MFTEARWPIWLSPWARPTVVVDFPSPRGVGVMAVTTTYLPRGRSASRRVMASNVSLAFVGPYSSSSSGRLPSSAAMSAIGRGLTPRAISRSDGKLIDLLERGGSALGGRGRFGRGHLAFGGADQVGQQQRIGQGAYATGDRGDGTGDARGG